MKKVRCLHICAALLTVLFLIFALAGCGEGGSGGEAPPVSDPGKGEAHSQTDGDDVQNEPAVSDDDMITVDSTEELLEAIAPNAEIVIEPGYYNMSEYIEAVWAEEGESWNEQHPYVRLQDCFDGVEAVICGVDGLSICGDADKVQLKTMVVLIFCRAVSLVCNFSRHFASPVPACAGHNRQRINDQSILVTIFRLMRT